MAKNFYTIHAPNDAWHSYAIAEKVGSSVRVKIDNYADLYFANARKSLIYYIEQAYRQLTKETMPVTITFDFRTK